MSRSVVGSNSSDDAKPTLSSRFAAASNKMSAMTGSYKTFLVAVSIIIVWGVSGPIFGFSDTWQLIINTGTTIVTFLMVFLIQNTQNRDAIAVHLKLDELIRALESADDRIMAAESVSESKLNEWQEKYAKLVEMNSNIEDKAEEVAEDVDEIADRTAAVAGAFKQAHPAAEEVGAKGD